MKNKEIMDMVEEIDSKGVGLTGWELDFIESMLEQTSFTDRQEAKIKTVWEERVH